MSEDSGYIGRKIFDARLGLSRGGPWTDKDGKDRIAEPSITIKTLDSKAPMKISARALLALYFLLHDDEEIRNEVRRRATLERDMDKEQDRLF